MNGYLAYIFGALLISTAALTGCSSSTPPPPEPMSAAEDPTPYEDTKVAELEAKLGQRVTFEGLAVNMKLGAGLMVGDHVIHMDGMSSWPEGYYEGRGKEKKVAVTGTLIVRHDLPVFVQEEGAPIMSGMPVPPGTDLHEASRRYLLTDFTHEPAP
jgi:hypothetical protein